MKRVKTALKLSLITLLATPNIVAADGIYQIQGDSMSPLMKNGEYVKVEEGKKGEDYKNGDIVVAEQKNGENVIKKIQDGLLVGENSYSLSIPREKTKIIGKAEKIGKPPEMKTMKMAKGAINDSPIKDIYTGKDFVLFLHEDTSITGFGSNINNVLGRTGGDTKSTSDLVLVSGPTGFERLVIGANEAYGLRLDSNTGLYSWIKIREHLNEKPYNGLVKDAATPGTPTWWTIQYVITPNGLVHVMGLDDIIGAGKKCPSKGCNWEWSDNAYVKYNGGNIENVVDIETAINGMLTAKTLDGSLYYVNNSINTVKLNNPDNVNIVKMDGGYNHFLGVDDKGVLYSWGNGGNGALGLGNTNSYYNTISKVSFPKNFYDEYKIIDFDAGGVFSIALAESKSSGEKIAYVWGRNEFGALGTDEVSINGIQTIPIPLKRKGTIVKNITQVAAGEKFMVALQKNIDGYLVWTSGLNDSGQLGGGTQLSTNVPLLVPGLANIKDIMASNGSLAYAMNADNQMIAWGYDARFPHNTKKSYPDVFDIGYSIGAFEKIHYWTADNWSREGPMFLIQKDTKMAYGYQDFCYSGGTSNTSTRNWLKIEPNSNYSNLVPGGKTYFDNVRDIINNTYPGGALIDSNGRIWSWGLTPLPIGTSDEINANCNVNNEPSFNSFKQAHPVKMGTNTLLPDGFEKLATNYSSSLGLRDGKLWVLPHGKTVSAAPINSSYAINNVRVTNIYGSYGALYAIDSNGEVWSWGTNYNGKLALGNGNNTSVPTKINKTYFEGKKIKEVACIWNTVLFLAEDSTVYAAGDNGWGQLGNGTALDSNIPVKVQNLKDIVKIASGPNFSLALDNLGRVWAWGKKSSGSLGDNFSISRGTLSTAVGNKIPEMTIESEIKNNYLSKTGNKVFVLTGKITEKEGENVTIKATVLGVEKELKITSNSWHSNEYDKIDPQEWSLEWNVDEFPSGTDFQSLTNVVAEDDRGGIVEQFYSGKIIVDNEKPKLSQYGDTCLVNISTSAEQCMPSDYFKINGTNGVNQLVRIYFETIQKSGTNRAIVKPQIQYRTKQSYGYPTTWSNWIDVDSYNQNGYYYDFFQGFLGETQIKLRSVDLARNVSEENSRYRYVIITNAGAEVKTINAKFGESENELFNEISFTGDTPSSSAIKSYSIDRRFSGESKWTNLTPTRVSWNGLTEATFKDESPELLGNTEYEYKVDIENSVTIGKGKTTSVITYPYYPVNFIRKVTSEGIDFTVKQDDRNKGEILYRLVLTDNRTGQIYKNDKKSSNNKEEVIFNVKEGDAPFSILNNSISIQLLIKGKNNDFITIVYDENFENAPSIISDKTAPEVYVNVQGNQEKIISNGVNKINLDLSATDDITSNSRLKMQLSPDGTNWYGRMSDGTWKKNIWSSYDMKISNFPLGANTGLKVIYARVKDEAGNIGMANTKLLIADLASRDSGSKIVDSDRNLSSQDTLNNNVIYVNDSYISLKIPKTGNLKEVQYSFDGVNWSPWEQLYSNDLKYITLPPIQGEHDIFVRYRNEFGDITTVTQGNDIIRYVLDNEKPNLNFETQNGTYIVKESFALMTLAATDNLSPIIKIELVNPEFTMIANNVTTKTIDAGNKLKNPVVIQGLKNGFNVISFKVTDKAGNSNLITIRLFKK